VPKLAPCLQIADFSERAPSFGTHQAGLYNLDEEDATGEGRLLLFDRNWTVVDQDPAAGTIVNADERILLALEEGRRVMFVRDPADASVTLGACRAPRSR